MSPRRAGSIAATAAIAMTLACTQAAMGAGSVDPEFAAAGTFGIGARAAALALAPDGRIVVAGDRRGAGGERALTARFLAAGATDASFDGGGAREDAYGTGASPQRASAVAVQADGSVIVAGVAGDEWSLARFEPTGLADGLFGAAGVTLRDPSPGDTVDEEYPDEEPALPDGTGPAAIAIAPGGDIVVAGNTGVDTDDGVPGEQIVVARFTSRGLPDPAFGADGFARLQLGSGSARRHAASAARGLVLRADGSIVIAGRASGPDGADRAFLAQLTPSGRLDTAFSRAGRDIVQLGRSSAARAAGSSLESLAMRPDGRLLAAGWATDVAGHRAVALARFTSLGALDASFGVRGSVVSQLGGAGRDASTPVSLARAVAVQPDAKVLVAGAASSASGAATSGGALVARFGGDGALDCGYGSSGRRLAYPRSGFDPDVDGAAAAAQPDGALLVAGRRPGGGVLLGRVLGGTSATVRSGTPRLVTLGARYVGHGRGYAYGLVDGRCASADVRFTVRPASGRAIATVARHVFGRSGPQVVCAPLHGLRPGGRYRIQIAATHGGVHGAQRVLRAIGAGRGRTPAQEGCGG